jgi:polyphosphate kinase
MTSDIDAVFQQLASLGKMRPLRQLLQAPFTLHKQMLASVARVAEAAAAGTTARIVVKINALTDHALIEALVNAAQAGARIDLIVRGACMLPPGIEGVTDRIRVRSIVGRFLEHSRIFWFHNRGHHKVFIGSADIMERNLDRRIEVLCPIHDPRLVQHLENVVLDACLRDTHCTRLLAADGEYGEPVSTEPPFNSQEHLLQWYAAERRA